MQKLLLSNLFTGQYAGINIGDDDFLLVKKVGVDGVVEQIVGSKLDVFEGSIADQTTTPIDFVNVTTGLGIVISNDNTAGDLLVYLYGDQETPFTVKTGEVFSLKDQQFSSLIIENLSGVTINYRIIIGGV